MLVLITGASSGLGYELSKEFNALGNELIMLAQETSLQKISKEFKDQKLVSLNLQKDDISDDVDDLFKNDLPDVIIHCAGSKIEEDKHPIDINILRKSMNLNLNSPIQINNYFVEKAKLNKRHLRIIHIGSDAGLTGRAAPSYSISKGALNTYVKNSGRSFAKDNIMMCCIVCSVFEHTNRDNSHKDSSSTTRGKFADVKEVADIVKSVAESKNMLYSSELLTVTAGDM